LEKSCRLLQRLSDSPFVFDFGSALQNVIGSSLGLAGRAAPSPSGMNADAFDLLERSGCVKTSPLLPRSDTDLFENTAEFFCGAPPGLNKFPQVNDSDRSEYARLVCRQLLSRKVCLLDKVSGGGAVFSVGKKDGAKLREVWHGRRASQAAPPPPMPPGLASPASLTDLEAEELRPYYLSKRDGRCLFDQLACPSSLTPYFARPAVSVDELLSSGLLTWQHVRESYRGCARPTRASKVHPASLVWPMGLSWSSYVAQCCSRAICSTAGLGERTLLAPDACIPRNMNELHAIATDDIIHFSKSPSQAGRRMNKLDQAFVQHGVVRHRQKDVDSCLSGTCLGVQLCNGRRLAPATSSLGQLLLCCLHLSSSPPDLKPEPRQLAAILGLAQWFCLLSRPLLSILHHRYGFARLTPDPQSCILPSTVKDEIQLFVCLSIYLESDLVRPWHETLYASDASPAFGFGLSAAKVGSSKVRDLASLSQRSRCHVRLLGDRSLEIPRLGVEYRLPVPPEAFRTLLSIKAKHKAHSGGLEAAGVTLMLRWNTPSRSRHSQRYCLMVDAFAVMGAVTKGRSSALTLRREVAKLGALTTAANILTRYIYVPSESNPADAPSRGIQKASKVCKASCQKSGSEVPSRCKGAHDSSFSFSSYIADLEKHFCESQGLGSIDECLSGVVN
jgi:hypothetical protein